MKRFRRLACVCAIVGVLLTVLVPHRVSFAGELKSAAEMKEMWWETKTYPLGYNTWGNYSMAEAYDIMNPPEEMMDFFSTKELAELTAQWHDFFNGFDYMYMFMECLEEKSLIFKTLLERPDGIHWMLKTYEACNMTVENGERVYGPRLGEDGYDWRTDSETEQFFRDFIDVYFYTFSEEDIELYNQIQDEKMARYELCSAESSQLWRRRFFKDGREMTKGEREESAYGSYTEKTCEEFWRLNRDFPFDWGMVPAGYRMHFARTDLMIGSAPPIMITNPPEDVLESFSTQELAELALKYPWVAAMDLGTKDIEWFFDRAEQEYTIYQELSAKEDSIACILDEYEKNQLYSYDVPNLTMEMIRKGNRYLVEELFVCRYIDRYKDRLTEADVERYLKIYKDKAETYDYIKGPEVRALFETELSLAEYGFSAEEYKPKDSGDFVVADIEPIIVEEPAPAAPKEWVPRETGESSDISDYPLLNCVEFAEEDSDSETNHISIVAAVIVTLAVCSGVAVLFIVRKNKRENK